MLDQEIKQKKRKVKDVTTLLTTNNNVELKIQKKNIVLLKKINRSMFTILKKLINVPTLYEYISPSFYFRGWDKMDG